MLAYGSRETIPWPWSWPWRNSACDKQRQSAAAGARGTGHGRLAWAGISHDAGGTEREFTGLSQQIGRTGRAGCRSASCRALSWWMLSVSSWRVPNELAVSRAVEVLAEVPRAMLQSGRAHRDSAICGGGDPTGQGPRGPATILPLSSANSNEARGCTSKTSPLRHYAWLPRIGS